MLGDSGVGKSSLVLRWTMDTFSPSLVSTVGVNFKSRKLNMRGEALQVQVWDTAGQEHFHKITTSYYKGAHGIMLVYDVSDKKSAESVEYWVKNIRSHASDTVQLALIGNKIDLRGHPESTGPSLNPSDNPASRTYVDHEYGKALSARYGVPFFETSAKDSSNVNSAYCTLVEHIMDCYSPPMNRRNTANFLHGGGGVADKRQQQNLLNRDNKSVSLNMKDKDRDRASSSLGNINTNTNNNNNNNNNNNSKQNAALSTPSATDDSLDSGGKGLFSSLRKPEHRRHSSSGSVLGFKNKSAGLPVNISGGPQPCSIANSHHEDKDKCSIS